jgi:hypothetical protein
MNEKNPKAPLPARREARGGLSKDLPVLRKSREPETEMRIVTPDKVVTPPAKTGGAAAAAAKAVAVIALLFAFAGSLWAATFSATNDTVYTPALGLYTSNSPGSFTFYGTTNLPPAGTNITVYTGTNITGVYLYPTNRPGIVQLTPLLALPGTNGANLSLINSNAFATASGPPLLATNAPGLPPTNSTWTP